VDTAVVRPRLRIIIVNYRLADMVADCLRSLEPEVGDDVEVVVVDNDSPDDSFATLSRLIPENGWDRFATLVASPKNGGFAYGNNVGIRPVLGTAQAPEYYMLLNPDTTVRPGALATMLEFMDAHPGVGIVGPRIESPNGVPQSASFRFPSLPSELLRGLQLGIVSELLKDYAVVRPQDDEAHQTDWVSGAAMIIRAEVVDTIGLMDDGYFLYYEETDYCLQAHRSGFSVWHLPSARVVHAAGSSTGVAGADESMKKQRRLPRYWNESRHRYFRKNYGPLVAAAADLLYGSSFASWRLRTRLMGKRDLAPPFVVRDLLRFRMEEAGLLKPPSR